MGKYNLENAARLDAIIRNAQDRNIYLQWVFISFGDFEWQWGVNAYNSANDGPCSTSQCFMENATARAFFKRYLRYHFARYGAYQALGMAEFWNEGDKDSVYNSNTVFHSWHEEMDAYWDSIDIYGRPTTTSFAWRDHEAQGTQYSSWHTLTFLSAANQHRYYASPDYADLWVREVQRIGTVGGEKPSFIGEFGTTDAEDNTSNDPNGFFYHDGAWVPFFFGQAAGTNLTWKVDARSDSYPHWGWNPHDPWGKGFKAFGLFVEPERPYLRSMSFMTPPTSGNVRINGYKSGNRALLLARDWTALYTNDSPPTVDGVSYTLSGMIDGDYTVQYWNTMTGSYTTASATASGGNLVLNPPSFHRALAIKVFNGAGPATPTPGPSPTPTSTSTPTPTSTACPGGSGSILREWWSNIGSGTSVSDIPLGTAPSGSSQPTSFEAPINWADNYGTRMRGWICPPASGSYTFWIASDDNSELWLSSNDQPASKVKIASVPGWTNSREWGKYAAQQSAPVSLVGGQRYYVEALHKEGGGGDNLAVAWQGPGIDRQVVPGSALYPAPDTAPPTATPTSTPPSDPGGCSGLSKVTGLTASSVVLEGGPNPGSGWGNLTDEQAAVGDPDSGDRVTPSTQYKGGNSGGTAIYIDLGSVRCVKRLWYYDFEGDAPIDLFTGAPGSWTLQTSLPTDFYTVWRSIDLNGGAGISTRYLRLYYPVNNSGIGEIVVYGGQ